MQLRRHHLKGWESPWLWAHGWIYRWIHEEFCLSRRIRMLSRSNFISLGSKLDESFPSLSQGGVERPGSNVVSLTPLNSRLVVQSLWLYFRSTPLWLSHHIDKKWTASQVGWVAAPCLTEIKWAVPQIFREARIHGLHLIWSIFIIHVLWMEMKYLPMKLS